MVAGAKAVPADCVGQRAHHGGCAVVGDPVGRARARSGRDEIRILTGLIVVIRERGICVKNSDAMPAHKMNKEFAPFQFKFGREPTSFANVAHYKYRGTRKLMQYKSRWRLSWIQIFPSSPPPTSPALTPPAEPEPPPLSPGRGGQCERGGGCCSDSCDVK